MVHFSRLEMIQLALWVRNDYLSALLEASMTKEGKKNLQTPSWHRNSKMEASQILAFPVTSVLLIISLKNLTEQL